MKKIINRYLLLTTFLTLTATLILAVAIFHALYRDRIIDDMRTYAKLLGGMVSSGEELKERYVYGAQASGGMPEEEAAERESGSDEPGQRSGTTEEKDPERSEKAGKAENTEEIENAEKAGETEKSEKAAVPQELRMTVISADGAVLYDSQTDGEVMENHAARPEIAAAEKNGEGYSVRHSDTLGSDMYYFAVRLENGDILRISKEENSIWSVFRSTIYGIVAIAVLMFLVCLVLSRYITARIVRPIEHLAAEIEQDRGIEIREESARPKGPADRGSGAGQAGEVRQDRGSGAGQTGEVRQDRGSGAGQAGEVRQDRGSGAGQAGEVRQDRKSGEGQPGGIRPDRKSELVQPYGFRQEPDGTYKELLPFLTTIRQQHEDIMKGVKMRQEFTANVSHELKTPLTSISGYAELIETGIAGEQETTRFAGEIRRNANRLLTLINDIIRLSELDGGHPEIARGEVDLHEIAQGCVEMLQISAASHDVRIQCHGHRCVVRADRGMMEELLFNLCDNAIRYNRPGGRVDVTVKAHRDQVFLTVRDTGIGIPRESQERVFERFYRVDKSRSKSTGGTGLGLAIVKHIVSLHQAELSLKSEAGKGTEITVRFDCP